MLTNKRSRGDESDGAAESSARSRQRVQPSTNTIIDRILQATDWRALFEVRTNFGDGNSDSIEAQWAARSVRNRLMRVAHPDRATDDVSMQRANAATSNINLLWEQAMRAFEPSGTSVSSHNDAAVQGMPTFGLGPSGMLMPPPSQPAAIEPGGALEILKRACALGERPPSMLERPELGVYVGFGNLDTLRSCKFLPMATNRCISQDVVAQRVAQNLARLRERGAYFDFGQISLVAVKNPSSEQYIEEDGQRYARFYVLDGQHRLTAMGELARERPNVPIWFELSVKVVADKAAANEALLHMQHCYHADPKCFFTRDDEADVASRVLDLAKLAWPNVFSTSAGARSSFARPQRPTIRPKLDDGLLFDVLRDTKLLFEVIRQQTLADGSELRPGTRPSVLFDALRAVNDAIRCAGPPGNVAQRTFAACAERHNGCYLGLYRRDETGAKIMERLRGLQVVPQDASCPLDAD